MNARINHHHLTSEEVELKARLASEKRVRFFTQRIASILNPGKYKNAQEFLSALEKLLKEYTLPTSNIKILHAKGGIYYSEDRTEYRVDSTDISILNGSRKNILSGRNTLYIRDSERMIILESLNKILHPEIIKILSPIIKSILGNLHAIPKINEDALTGLYNRGRLHEVATGLNTNTESNYVVIMIDLDGFKKVNDMYGHEVGNIALKKIATVLARSFRHDEVFRYGGDEFTIVMSFPVSMSREEREGIVSQRLEVLDREMTELNSSDGGAVLSDGIAHTLGFSLGVAYSQKGESFETIMKRADEVAMRVKQDKKISPTKEK